jgi:rhamnogalacturonyl hydrolase YesR
MTSRILLCASVAIACAAADAIPRRQETLAIMRRVNDWQKANPRMKPGDRNWERGTWYTGVMASWKATKDRAVLDQALAWGKQHEWQVGTEIGGGNRLFCVETWAELYLKQRDRSMIAPAIQWLDTNAPNSPGGARRWYLERTYPYVDSLYGAAALAMLSKATGNPKYIRIMHAFFDDVTGELFDKESGLYYRDYRFKGKLSPNGKKIFWARGNGWAFAGIARILEYLPKNDPKRAEYVAIYRRMANELVKRQPADGLWRASLDDPEALPNPETSGAGFFCYGLAWGINHGLLDRKEYLPAVKKAWNGLVQSVSPEGMVLWGQQVDAQPNAAERDSTHEYVTGAFLLAGSEVYKLAGAK